MTGYGGYFTQDSKYMGKWVFQDHTTRTKLNEINEEYPYLFRTFFYDTHEGDYQAIEVDLKGYERFKGSSCLVMICDYIGTLQELMEMMEVAIKNDFKLFLGSE